MQSRSMKVAVFVALVTVAIVGRLTADDPNVPPLAAAVLFAGFCFRSWFTAAAVGLIAMTFSDAVIGAYELPVMISVYLSLAAPLVLRPLLKAKLTAGRVALSAVASSLFFFLITNYAV